jgi:DNA-binding SARP family transcriptional activator
MEPSLPFDQGTLTVAFEASSPAILLERGIHCTRQGSYIEGVIYFARARELLSPDQMHFAAALDAFIESHARYLQAQQSLHTASKRFAEAETEQQTQLVALEKVLLAFTKEMDRAPQSHVIAQPTKRPEEHQLPQLPQLPSMDSNYGEPLLSPHSFPADCEILPALHFTCFGRFEVRRLGQLILPCSSRSGQSILRYLVAQPGHCATIDVLTALIWPEDRAEVAQPKLHSAISALRRSLNHGYNRNSGCGYVMCKNRVYYLNPAVVIQTDVEEFLQCYEVGQQISEGRVALYEKACRLYTGTFLPEDLYADWSSLQREHLNRIYLTMCRVITDHYLRTKRYEDAAKWATAILNVNRCDEGAHRQLIQIYAAQGLRSEALQQYQRCEYLLREELGVAPLPETMHVLQKLLTSAPSSTDTAKMQ